MGLRTFSHSAFALTIAMVAPIKKSILGRDYVMATSPKRHSWFMVGVALALAVAPSWAAEDTRFIEFPSETNVDSYDMNTVQIIQPGRFSVVKTKIDNPDIMKFRLKVLTTLRDFCEKPQGKYDPPKDVFTLGRPDMAINSIHVKTGQNSFGAYKRVQWSYPYDRLALHGRKESIQYPDSVSCGEEQSDIEHLRVLRNGLREKELYDCKRGLTGMFIHEEDDSSKVITGSVNSRSNGSLYYVKLCYTVTHEMPYMPAD